MKTPDYTLEEIAVAQNTEERLPEISSVRVLKVEDPEVRCSKGDCDQDYAPG